MNSNSPRRLGLLTIPVIVIDAAGTLAFADVLAGDGFHVLDVFLGAIFAILFGWVAFWFWLNGIGAWRLWKTRAARRHIRRSSDVSVEGFPSTAVLIPIHKESVRDVFARIHAMLDSVAETKVASKFDFFVLSDSNDSDAWLQEELAWAELRRERVGAPNVYYRRRPTKFRKKSGNIADFCERWGIRYEFMIVLDADSIMNATTMVELVQRMQQVPNLGILQAPALPVQSRTVYGRFQQFAASVFGPSIFAGLGYCFQDNANFWGHNAIIRTSAFMRHCGLPALSGRPPFGGPIMSHDFVEAALMSRAGYAVRVAWDLTVGSYEHCPASLGAAAIRDRRWCQGNLQHLRLVFSSSFLLPSKMHFAIGVLFYAMSAFWGAFVALFVLLVAATGDESAGDVAVTASLGLLVATLVFLFAGKLASVVLLLRDERRALQHGGRRKALASVGLELLVSFFIAPVLMVTHITCLASVLFGLSVDWGAAHRDESTTPWRDAFRQYRVHTLCGLAIAGVGKLISASLFWWLAPIWGGLCVSIPVCAVLGSAAWGERFRRRGLFLTASETDPPPILARLDRGFPELRTLALTFPERFSLIVKDAWLNTMHTSLLAALDARSRPRPVLESLVQRALRDGPRELDEGELLALLSDPWAVRRLHEAALGDAETPIEQLLAPAEAVRGTESASSSPVNP